MRGAVGGWVLTADVVPRGIFVRDQLVTHSGSMMTRILKVFFQILKFLLFNLASSQGEAQRRHREMQQAQQDKHGPAPLPRHSSTLYEVSFL